MGIVNDLPRLRRTDELIKLNATSANIVNLQFNYQIQIIYPVHDEYDFDFLDDRESPSVKQVLVHGEVNEDLERDCGCHRKHADILQSLPECNFLSYHLISKV